MKNKLKWKFYKGRDKKWWWRATYVSNGKIANGSSQGYSRRIDCISNAEDFGYRKK